MKERTRTDRSTLQRVFRSCGGTDGRRQLIIPVVTLLVICVCMLALSSCVLFQGARSNKLERSIVGSWLAATGGEISFYADQSGFIPRIPNAAEPVPDTPFTYTILDESHIEIRLSENRRLDVELTVEGDRMTWRAQGSGTEYVFERAK